MPRYVMLNSDFADDWELLTLVSCGLPAHKQVCYLPTKKHLSQTPNDAKSANGCWGLIPLSWRDRRRGASMARRLRVRRPVQVTWTNAIRGKKRPALVIVQPLRRSVPVQTKDQGQNQLCYSIIRQSVWNNNTSRLLPEQSQLRAERSTGRQYARHFSMRGI